MDIDPYSACQPSPSTPLFDKYHKMCVYHLLSTISNVFSATLACAVWCADPKGVRIWRCATTADTLKKFAHSAEVRTGCRHATDPPTIHSNDNTSNDNVVVLHVLRMDSYKFPPVSYSVAVTRGGEAKQ